MKTTNDDHFTKRSTGRADCSFPVGPGRGVVQPLSINPSANDAQTVHRRPCDIHNAIAIAIELRYASTAITTTHYQFNYIYFRYKKS